MEGSLSIQNRSGINAEITRRRFILAASASVICAQVTPGSIASNSASLHFVDATKAAEFVSHVERGEPLRFPEDVTGFDFLQAFRSMSSDNILRDPAHIKGLHV